MGRAIVREPAVFLFDEPLSNLDAKLRVQMRFEIQKLHRRLGTTSMYVTHDQVEAMTLAQRMIVMHAGRAEQIGTPMEVYENPASVFVAGFIGSPAMNFLAATVESGGRIVLDGGGAIATGTNVGEGRKVTAGVRPEHLTPCAPSAANLVGSVEMIEALGADTLIHVAVAGGSIIARLPPGTAATVGEPIALAAAPTRVYLFDATSGARIA
jgi:sn-glycerol 3-phosphate transport system ATP-binding protein